MYVFCETVGDYEGALSTIEHNEIKCIFVNCNQNSRYKIQQLNMIFRINITFIKNRKIFKLLLLVRSLLGTVAVNINIAKNQSKFNNVIKKLGPFFVRDSLIPLSMGDDKNYLEFTHDRDKYNSKNFKKIDNWKQILHQIHKSNKSELVVKKNRTVVIGKNFARKYNSLEIKKHLMESLHKKFGKFDYYPHPRETVKEIEILKNFSFCDVKYDHPITTVGKYDVYLVIASSFAQVFLELNIKYYWVYPSSEFEAVSGQYGRFHNGAIKTINE